MNTQAPSSAVAGAPLLPPDGVASVCHFDDGILYVAASAALNAEVLAWERKLMRMGVLRHKETESLDDLGKRKNALSSARKKLNAADELKQALAFLELGVKLKASDLHFVVEDSACRVRYRVDGFLETYTELPADAALQYISALYVASDVKNRGGFSFMSPIAARLRSGLPEGLYAVRFASMKTDRGGMVVLRLLYDTVANRAHQSRVDLPTLGFDAEQVRALQAMAEAPNGLIVIDGPTGSGKSTTLKYVLQWVRQQYPAFNIITVEDPPEYPIVGAQQVPVLVQEDDMEDAARRSAAYGSIISTTLRLDPDILMVGEVRDGTSAVAAMRAAITGHRLWTTVHANDAWEAVNRLVDLLREGGMQDPMSVLANTQNLTGLIAQRLVPTLCDGCKIPLSEHRDQLSQHVMDELFAAVDDLDASQVYLRGPGCSKCMPHTGPVIDGAAQNSEDQRRGIHGRTVVAEIVLPSQRLLDVAREKGIPAAREWWLRYGGGRTITDHALAKIRAGVVAPDVAREFIGPLVSSRQILAQMSTTEK